MKLLTWNIQWGRGCDGRVALERIVREVHRLGDFDVLCLQEVSAGYPELRGCDGSDQFAALAALLPGYAAFEGVATDAPGPNGRRRFGNLILSRLPVLQVFRHLLPWPAEPGCSSMQRMALEINLEAAGGPLRITTTHLEYYAAGQRMAQVERLRELHREAVGQALHPRTEAAARGPFAQVPRAGPAVLTGDFNCRPGSAEHRRLLAGYDDATPGYRDAQALVHPGRSHAPTVGVHDKRQWPGEPFACDFVCVSADIAARVQRLEVDPSTDASDHQPVWLELADA